MLEELSESQIVRAKVEEALRFLVKNLPIRKLENAAEGEAFLEIPGPKGEAIEFFEKDGRVELEFGFSAESFDFSGGWSDVEGGEGEDSDILEEGVDPDESATEAEEDFREELEALVNTTLDIIEETLFSAKYKKLLIEMGGLFPAEEFEAMKGLNAFESVSWNGSFNSKAAA
jgi:hypothetical protein